MPGVTILYQRLNRCASTSRTNSKSDSSCARGANSESRCKKFKCRITLSNRGEGFGRRSRGHIREILPDFPLERIEIGFQNWKLLGAVQCAQSES